MPSPQTAPLIVPGDISAAIALLTRLPLPADHTRGAASAWAWPIAGLIPAILAAILGNLALAFGLAAPLAAAIILTTLIVTTGALHEDGLADCADGFWGGHDATRRLEIMKDSRVGSYGVIATVLSLMIRWSALTLLVAQGWIIAPLLAVALLSRAVMPVLMAAMPNARGSGLSARIGAPSQATASLAVIIAVVAGFILIGGTLLVPLVAVSLAAIALAAIAKTKIGGQTGDVLGAAQQVAEIAALAALTTTFGA